MGGIVFKIFFSFIVVCFSVSFYNMLEFVVVEFMLLFENYCFIFWEISRIIGKIFLLVFFVFVVVFEILVFCRFVLIWGKCEVRNFVKVEELG